MKATVAVIAAIIAVVAVLFVATEQTAPPEMTDAEIAQIEAEVIQELEARTDAFWEAVLSGNPQAVASFWTSDALLLEPGIRVTGSEIPAFMEETFGSMAITAFEEEYLDWFVHGEVAYLISAYDETIQVEGEEPLMVRNYGFVRWEKEDGVWKMDRLVAGPRDAPPEG